METAWMGRYRPLVTAVIRHGNMVSRIMPTRFPLPSGPALNQQEWQILEYLLQYEQEEVCMCRISERLGIAQSSLSKAVKNLCRYELAERFHRGENRKNVILHATPLGQALYLSYAPCLRDEYFAGFFEALKGLDDAALAAFTEGLERLTECLSKELSSVTPVSADAPEEN